MRQISVKSVLDDHVTGDVSGLAEAALRATPSIKPDIWGVGRSVGLQNAIGRV
jgi:hypothetical protein